MVSIALSTEENAIWTLSEKQTGQSINFAAPTFEVDGKQLTALPKQWDMVNAPDTLRNGVVEYKYKGILLADTSMSLQVTFRVSPQSPVVRFCYKLESKSSHSLTKTSGKDSLTYFSTNISGFQKFSEIRISDFNEQFHSFNLNDRPIDDRFFEDNMSVIGPILVSENNDATFLFAYEHGAQIPDRFIEFGLNSSKSITLKAKKGNYYNKQPLDALNPYETIWFEAAAVKGSKQTMAQNYRTFMLKDIAINTSSRTPYIYYNTWGFQERNKCWNGKKYLTDLNLEHTLNEIAVAHKIGVDVFVIDAGWFSKTGGWKANPISFPDSLRQIKAALDSFHMKLGLWYRPTQAAVTSSVAMRNSNFKTSFNGHQGEPSEVWETEPSYSMCLLSAIKKTPHFLRISFLGNFIKVILSSDMVEYPRYSALYFLNSPKT